ncbi:hypothetical protein P0D69_03610 [Paraburkholderia sediminicola]
MLTKSMVLPSQAYEVKLAPRPALSSVLKFEGDEGVTGEVIITGSKGITLGDGAGAYVKIANGKIEIASPGGQIEVKGKLNIADPAGGNFTFPNWSDAPLRDVKGNMDFGFSE